MPIFIGTSVKNQASISVGTQQMGKVYCGDKLVWQKAPKGLGYGALYSWYAASNANFCPSGWHLPSSTDVENLASYLEPSWNQSSNSVGGKLKEVGITYWTSPNTGATNQVGFTARGSGYRDHYGIFLYDKEKNYFFNAESHPAGARVSLMSYNNATLQTTKTNVAYFITDKNAGTSIRLIKDSGTATEVTDIDGNVYPCVTIGSQCWLAANWKCEHFNDGTVIPIVTDNTAWAALTTPGMCYYGNDIGNA